MRYLLILCCYFPLGLLAQVGERMMPTPENYEWAMGLETPTNDDVEQMVPLAENYFEVNYDSAFALAERVVAIDSTQLADTTLVRQLYTQALIFDRKQQYEQTQSIAENALQQAENLNSIRLTAQIKSMLGRGAADRQNFQTALELFNAAADGFGMTKDSVNWIKNRIYSARILGYIDSWDAGLTILEELYPVARRTKNSMVITEVPYWIGVAYGKFFLQYYNQIRSGDFDNGSKKEYVDSVKHYYTLADKYYEQSKSIAETYNYRKFQAIALMEQIDNIIYYNNVTGGENNRATELGVYRSYLNETEQLTNELNANEIKLLYYFSAGKVAVEQSDYATSIEYGERIVETAKKTNDVAKVVLGYYSMANGYYGARDFKNAYDFIEKTYLTQIEKITTDNSTMLLDLETKYQTAQKEQEITQQRNDILELEVANAAVTRQRNLAVGGGIFLLLMGYLTYWLNKVVQDRNDKRAFAEALLLAQDTERKRIARDLHDGVGQSLLLLIKQTERNEIDSNINQKLMMETLEEVRSISRDLHPFKIDKLGLTSAIEDILNRVEQSTDLFLTHELENIDSAIAKKDQIHLYRVVQEAMNNIVKHSGATAAKVTVENLEKSVHITIRDNGKGFDHELAIVKTKSLGLRTMHERITNLNGEFTIKNNEPSGVLLEISVPKQV